MFTKKEITWIIIAIIILGFIIEFSDQSFNTGNFIESHPGFLFAIPIILVPVITKKLVSGIYNIKVEHSIWKAQRWWFTERAKFKRAFPIGLVIPFFLSLMSLGYIKIMTLLQFDAENLPKKRLLKKRGEVRKTEINESDLAFTAAWGFWSLILLAILTAILNQPELAKYSIYYGIWNIIPISQLDGTKLFFGSFPNWVILVIAYIISLVLVLL